MTTSVLRSEEEVSGVKSSSSSLSITLGGSAGGRSPGAGMASAAAASFFASNAISEQANPLMMDSGSVHRSEVIDDYSPGAHRDDDDDDEDDNDDKIDFQSHDPERLKAFNMFVRLFVDENLDRAVPISRQPREKVQAIIDSCVRQFPEFGERARKRIRTYLKSCRRNKRSRDSSGIDLQNRPMPPHLTSVAAEQILAQACENENQNAKRIRMGLEPISQPLPSNPTNDRAPVENSNSPLNLGSSEAITANSATTTTGGPSNGLFRPAFGPYQRQPPTTACTSSTTTANGPTDLSTKAKSSNVSSSSTASAASSSVNRSSPLPHKLNAAEILAVRQLIMGYRESAAFLLRSAEELEQLLLQQRSTS